LTLMVFTSLTIAFFGEPSKNMLKLERVEY
jgi:hypothetical protein